MDYSIYIIKQNTPESKLLSYAGIDRSTLEVVKWKGRKQVNGGFGRSPIEWKIEGTRNVANLCNGIIRILSNRKTLTSAENDALVRAVKTIKGIQNASLQLQQDAELKSNKKLAIESFIKYRYPSLTKTKVSHLVNSLSERSFNSMPELIQSASQEVIEIKSIEEAQEIFTKIMKIG
jgi:hypothetical protein